MTIINLKIDQLLLDQENPRHPAVGSQRDALRALLADSDDAEKLFRLADSIASRGLSPIDRFLVFKDGSNKKYTMLEGNRRVAALKILTNPNILADMEIADALRKRFETLAANFDRTTVEPINCYQVEDRAAGASWLNLRHTGENAGRGVVGWTAIQQRRFAGGDPALQALEFVVKHGNLDPEDEALLGVDYPITTLDRLLSAKDVRKRIGVEVVKRKLKSGLPAEELLKPLRKMVLDLGRRSIKVGDLMNSTQQSAYIDTFKKAEMPELKSAGQVRSVEEIEKSDPNSKPSPSPRPPTKPDPSKRRHVVPRGARLSVSNAKIAEILDEVRTLDVEKYAHAVAVLTRVFLELSVDHYLDNNGSSTRYKDAKTGRMIDKKLKAKVVEVIDILVSKHGADARHLRPVERSVSRADSPLSVELLHDYVHNKFSHPKRKDLLNAWDEATPLFQSIWK